MSERQSAESGDRMNGWTWGALGLMGVAMVALFVGTVAMTGFFGAMLVWITMAGIAVALVVVLRLLVGLILDDPA